MFCFFFYLDFFYTLVFFQSYQDSNEQKKSPRKANNCITRVPFWGTKGKKQTAKALCSIKLKSIPGTSISGRGQGLPKSSQFQSEEGLEFPRSLRLGVIRVA